MIAAGFSEGQPLRNTRLRPLEDGVIQPSQSVLIANHTVLKNNPQALAVVRQLLEFVEARLRAKDNLSIFANMRGESPEAIAARMFTQHTIGGPNGPANTPMVVPDPDPHLDHLHNL